MSQVQQSFASVSRVPRLDKLGVLVALVVGGASAFLPFVISKPNRIVLGEALPIHTALPAEMAALLLAIVAIGTFVALLRTPTLWRLIAGFVLVGVLTVMLGASADWLIPEGNTVARVSPGAGFWLLSFAFALVAADALVRLRLGPLVRLATLAVVAVVFGAILWGGLWDDASVLREYANRGDTFWAEARTHLFLAFGSLGAATLVGVPLGVWAYRFRRLRVGLLNTLNVVQTVPSIALFGLLIAPLAWVAANVPGASAAGVSGIGVAPAMVALFAYSLLPIVANTVSGLQSVPAAVKEAARGMGMTRWQMLFGAEVPLALPIILTGIRVVLVQNIGLATIAALIGGGGFGVFVFQGIGQTAMDLVLLGAIPTVALAFASAIVMDALVDIASPGKARSA
ncbi:ABC transporter permease [Devosia rhizoryzae]|uniref:ABC transporter permease n=1 Tax=Devosia rhizoryzae TaxID=2774137 RepID=A0ABX7CBZ2_9HYPH|nr:ABC transporter permease [Devosia rhizoryzae]QQR40799.1 ABC transporter permease [Devosia rhizoryzae]